MRRCTERGKSKQAIELNICNVSYHSDIEYINYEMKCFADQISMLDPNSMECMQISS